MMDSLVMVQSHGNTRHDYTITPHFIMCTDIDECVRNLSLCQPDSYCDNTIGSYLCICNVGYSGDGFVSCTSKSGVGHKLIVVSFIVCFRYQRMSAW